MAAEIILPTPVEDVGERDTRRKDSERSSIYTVGRAKARARVLDALALIRETHQGISVAEQQNAASDVLDDAEGAHEERIAELSEAGRNAERDRVQEATIDILAGMVARLLAEK
jgi:hypothetical protein